MRPHCFLALDNFVERTCPPLRVLTHFVHYFRGELLGTTLFLRLQAASSPPYDLRVLALIGNKNSIARSLCLCELSALLGKRKNTAGIVVTCVVVYVSNTKQIAPTIMPEAFWASRWKLPLSLITFLCVTFWTTRGLGGLGSTGKKLFNWHPLLMSLATLVLLPQGALLWSSLPPQIPIDAPERVRAKKLHAFMQMLGFVIANIGICLAYASHQQQGLPNFYSVHSWIGIGALILMKSNVFGGLVSTLLPKWRAAKLTKSVHRRVGITALALSFSAAISGLAEQQGFLVKDTGNPFHPQAVIAGMISILFICMGGLVVVALEERRSEGSQGMNAVAEHGGLPGGKIIDDVHDVGVAKAKLASGQV